MATWLLNQGMPIHSLRKLFGHDHLNATQIYAGLCDQTLYGHFREATAPPEDLATKEWPVVTATVTAQAPAEMEISETDGT